MSSHAEAITIPCVIFAAKSTEDTKGSIPDQLKDGRKLADQLRYEVAGEYQDEAKSAYHGNRGDGLERAMSECERLSAAHGSCALIVQHSDRLARGDAKQAKHLVEYAVWAIKHDVRLHSVQDPEILSGGDYGLVMSAIGGLRNHQDSKRKAQSVRDGSRRRAERGKLAGGPRPYGYRWEGPRLEKVLVIVPEEAAVVLRMFEDTVSGVSQRALARRLTEEGVPSATRKPWGQASVGRVLSNPLYKGMVRHTESLDGGGQRVHLFEGTHQAIVSPELWDEAATRRVGTARRGRGRWPKGAHLLTKGLLRCGNCGYAMIPRTDPYRTRADGVTYQIYQCHGRITRGVGFCDRGSVRRELVDEAIRTELIRYYTDLDEAQTSIERGLAANLAVAREALAQAERDLLAVNADARQARIKRGWQENVLSDDEYSIQRQEVEAERAAAQAALDRHAHHVEHVEQGAADFDSEKALLRRLADQKAAVAGEFGRAPDLNALRTLVLQRIQSVELLSPEQPFGSGAVVVV